MKRYKFTRAIIPSLLFVAIILIIVVMGVALNMPVIRIDLTGTVCPRNIVC